MSRILIVSSYNRYGANSNCIRNIVEELNRRGHKVVVLSEYQGRQKRYEREGDIEIYRASKSGFLEKSDSGSMYIKNFYKIINRIIHLVVAIPFYPNVSPLKSFFLYKKAVSLNKQYGFELIIGVYRPYETLNCALLLKKKIGSSIKAAVYHLDLLSNPNNSNWLVLKYKSKRGKNAFKKEASICDAIILPLNCNEYEIEESEKIMRLDFPLFVDKESTIENYNDIRCKYMSIMKRDSINIVYAGTIDSINRNPESIISFIKSSPIINGRKVALHIWGVLSDDNVREMVLKTDSVYYHGIIEGEIVPIVLECADVLLNISNKITYNMIPSKIFQLFSCDKPIINIVQNMEDVSLRYFKMAAGVINVYDVSNINEILENFLLGLDEMIVKNNKNIFVKSTPEYAADIIEGILCC